MTETIVFKKSFSIACVSLLQAIFPPVAVFVCLYTICLSVEEKFSTQFMLLGVLGAALTAALVRQLREENSSLLPARSSIVWNVLVRWTVVFCLLLAIGYALKIS